MVGPYKGIFKRILDIYLRNLRLRRRSLRTFFAYSTGSKFFPQPFLITSGITGPSSGTMRAISSMLRSSGGAISTQWRVKGGMSFSLVISGVSS